MNIKAIKTGRIVPNHEKLTTILDRYISGFSEQSILVITSKIISICEGRVVKVGTTSKTALVEKEAEMVLPSKNALFDITLTIKNNILIPTAGIDESNGDGYYILWPSDPQKSANNIRKYLCERFSLKLVGVLVTDSKTTPLRWGTTGTSLAQSGFVALNNYIGKPDIFGRKLEVTKANIADGLAAAAVVVMGEGKEQTPLAIITEVPFVKFQMRNPTGEEIRKRTIAMKDDLYAPLLTSAMWKKMK